MKQRENWARVTIKRSRTRTQNKIYVYKGERATSRSFQAARLPWWSTATVRWWPISLATSR